MRDCPETRGTDTRPIKVKTTKAARIDGQDAQSDFTNMREFPPSSKRVEPRNMILIRRDSIGRGGGTIWKPTEIANRTKGQCSKLPGRTAWRQSRLGRPSCEAVKVLGFLYIDGHVRAYHGKRQVPKAYVTRMHLAVRATTDSWVNDQRGDPLFVVTAETNAAMTKMLIPVLSEVRELLGSRRHSTVVFDRAGWSPGLFQELLAMDFDILTYRKG